MKKLSFVNSLKKHGFCSSGFCVDEKSVVKCKSDFIRLILTVMQIRSRVKWKKERCTADSAFVKVSLLKK
jgi:hypothetical protein